MLELAVGQPAEAFLRPVATHRGKLNSDDVRMLSAWRNRFVTAFLTEFEANEERTGRWLADVVGPDDTRILFMVDDAQSGQTVGYMGLAFIEWSQGRGEVDSLVRGGPAPPGMMIRSVTTMLDWARQQLGLTIFGARVRSDNPKVLAFFRALGFAEVRRVPLRRCKKPDMVQWIEDQSLPANEPSLVHVVLKEAPLESDNKER
jgi:RimJ/RimL family protein N-acetyltransferase